MKFIIKSKQTLLNELNTYFQAHPELYAKFGVTENSVMTELPADANDVRFNEVFLNMYGGKLVMLDTEVQECEHTFQNKYSAAGDNPAFYENLNFPWSAFSDTALQGMNPSQFVLGVIHRFDVAASRWWLSAERFTFPGYTGAPSYPITSTNTLFDLPAGGPVSPYSGGLSQGSGSLYDPAYFSDVRFDSAPINSDYVSRLCFAWAELSQLYSENRDNIPGAVDTLFSINFCSMSSDYSSQIPGTVLVPFPHCITMYMSYDGKPLLGDSAIVLSTQFVNHAADYSSLCPNSCPVYIWPAGLQPL